MVTQPKREDKGRLLLLTYLIMKIELESLGENPRREDVFALNLKHMMTLEIVDKSVENDPDICAELEPLATAIILGCPDYSLYAAPITVLQKVAVAGRAWQVENEVSDGWREESNEFIQRTMTWLKDLDDVATERFKSGKGFTSEEMGKFFSDQFQTGLSEFVKKREERGDPKVHDLIQDVIDEGLNDLKMEQMLANMDPLDIN